MALAPEPLEGLIEKAIASSVSERVERYRDPLAAFGDDVVHPLLALARQQPDMGLFAITVLEAAARHGSEQSRTGLDVLASQATDLLTRKAAREARSRTGGPLVPQTDLPQASEASASSAGSDRRRSPDDTMHLINVARKRRGEPTLDAAEARQVLANLERRAADPDRYRNVCWKCDAAVDAATNERCRYCQWLVCWCGGCRAPNFRDRRTGESGHCRREVWLAARESEIVQEIIDVDYRGVAIVTAGPPASDEKEIWALLTRQGVRAVLHWTPLRNLGSILEQGLLSREALARRRIPIVPHGYGSAEKERALRDYVCVSLEPKPWMMNQWSETPVVLEIDAASLLADGTLFVPGNSASRSFDAKDLLLLRGAPSVEKLFQSGSMTPQAEAWVPGAVPRIAILAIHTRDASTAKSVHASGVLAGMTRRPSLHVTPEFFLDETLEPPA